MKTWDARALYVPWSAFPRTELPVVATVHELPFVRLGPIEGRVRAHRHRTWLLRAAEECAAIVVPSEATREDLLSLVPSPRAAIHRIPNGFDPTVWTAVGAAVEPVSRPRIVMVGTGAAGWGPKKKGLDVLLEAVGLLDRPDLEGVIVGEVGTSLPAGWSAVGPDIEEEALHHLVASATVLVHPARSEGFGYPPLEAMAAGTPVVVANGGALCETVGDAALVTLAGDPTDLAQALARVLDDAPLGETLVKRGRERAQAFPPRDMGVRYYEVLKEAQAAK
jgi:glycosyltransferase involved in cell wall biosynthesis